MTREELVERIAKGAAYLQRTDLTENQREIAQQIYDKARHELRLLDQPPSESDRIQMYRDSIREILKPIAKERAR
jgi:vacuolar-type H+-ATPase subunit E/Vma4